MPDGNNQSNKMWPAMEQCLICCFATQHRRVIRGEAKCSAIEPSYRCEQHLENTKMPFLYFLIFQFWQQSCTLQLVIRINTICSTGSRGKQPDIPLAYPGMSKPRKVFQDSVCWFTLNLRGNENGQVQPLSFKMVQTNSLWRHCWTRQ